MLDETCEQVWGLYGMDGWISEEGDEVMDCGVVCWGWVVISILVVFVFISGVP